MSAGFVSGPGRNKLRYERTNGTLERKRLLPVEACRPRHLGGCGIVGVRGVTSTRASIFASHPTISLRGLGVIGVAWFGVAHWLPSIRIRLPID